MKNLLSHHITSMTGRWRCQATPVRITPDGRRRAGYGVEITRLTTPAEKVGFPKICPLQPVRKGIPLTKFGTPKLNHSKRIVTRHRN